MRENQGYRDTYADIRATFNVGLLTVKQVAEYMNCDHRTITRLIQKKKLPAIDLSAGVNHQYRVTIDALARFVTKEK